MQQPWWAYLTAVNLFSLSITDNTFMLLQSCQSWFGLPDYNPITVNASCLSPNNVGFVWFLLLGCCFVMFCVRLIWLHCVVYWTCGWLRMFWLWVSVWLSAHSGNGQCDKRIVKSFHCQPISEHCMYIVYCQTITTQHMYIVTWSHCHIISTQHIVGK